MNFSINHTSIILYYNNDLVISLTISPGTDIEECPAGKKEVRGKCTPCIPEAGEYQTMPGKNYCEAVKPGYSQPETPDLGMDIIIT